MLMSDFLQLSKFDPEGNPISFLSTKLTDKFDSDIAISWHGNFDSGLNEVKEKLPIKVAIFDTDPSNPLAGFSHNYQCTIFLSGFGDEPTIAKFNVYSAE
jgi:hypothetical protein